MEDTSKVAPEAAEAQESSSNPDSLQACQAELEEMKSRYLYLNAEFDNYKKRTAKEQATWAEYAQDQSLLDLLAIIDDLELALVGLEAQELSEGEMSHFEGFSLIIKNVGQLLKKYNIEEIEDQKIFDPEYFEAIMQQESPDHQSGEIVSVIKKGYKRKERVMRPAKVIVAK